MINWELISVIVFYSLLGIIIYRNRKKMEVVDKIFFVYKWKKGVEYIKKLIKPDWLWKILSTISIPVCLFFLVFAVHMLFESAITMIESPNPQPGVGLLIPGVKLPGSDLYVPFWYGIISIIILAVVHETSHGIICLVEKIKLKTTGVGMLLFMPLAFVEPDQKSFLKSKRLSRIRMLSAGSFANLVTAFLAFLLVVHLVTPFVEGMIDYTDVVISSTIEGMPAQLAGIPNNSKILMINNVTINNITDFYYELIELKPNETINLTTENNTYTLTTTSNPSNESMAYLGVMAEQDWDFKQELSVYPEFLLNIPFFLMNLLMWVSNLNFAVGVFNLFPLWITDGGKILIEILSIVFKKKETLYSIVSSIFFVMLGLLLFNFFYPYFL